MNTFKTALLIFVASMSVAMAACQPKEGPAERAGKSIDNAGEKAGQQIERAGEKIENAADRKK